MIIQEAITSGKPFKREPDKEDEYLIVDSNNIIRFEQHKDDPRITAHDITQTDWMVRE